MKNCCVVVADGRTARLYLLEEAKELVSGSRLVEQAELFNAENAARGFDAPGKRSERNTDRQSGPMHPYGDKRQQHRVEVDQRFARDVAGHTLSLLGGWKMGVLLLVAEPHMLGLMRDALQSALNSGIELKELARDYTHLTPNKLHRQLRL
jgi:protein required for attachment to host cells